MDDATCIREGCACGQKLAFRIVLVWRQECELLGMKWKEAYYVDTCLPFGLRSAPYLFNQFAEVLQWILQHNYGLQWLVHYLDDYLLVGAPDSHSCREHLQESEHASRVPSCQGQSSWPSNSSPLSGLSFAADTLAT